MEENKPERETNEEKWKVRHSLKKIFISELKSIYWIEKHSARMLRKMERSSSAWDLKASFRGHFVATEEHLNRLMHIFKLLNEKPGSKKCKGMHEIFIETRALIKNTERNTLSREMGLIDMALKMELLEINKYGRLMRLSNRIKEFIVSGLLKETLFEEKEAEETYTAVKEDILKDEIFMTQKEENVEEYYGEMEELVETEAAE